MLFKFQFQHIRGLSPLLIVSLLLMGACLGVPDGREGDREGDREGSGDYYTPNIDLFIFRHNVNLMNVPIAQEGFNIDGQNNIVNYLYQFFSTTSEASINPYQGQNKMLFHRSKIRAIIVTPHRSLDTTYAGAYALTPDQTQIICKLANSSFNVSLSTAGILPNRLLSTNDNQYVSDLSVAGLQLAGKPDSLHRKLYLTNSEGTEQSGREINIENNNIRIFFANRISPCTKPAATPSKIDRAPAGLALVGTRNLLGPRQRYESLIAIAGKYNLGSRKSNDGTRTYFFGQQDTTENLRLTLSHEMGHFFGLRHSFSDDSCDTQEQHTTDRIMDYFDPNRSPIRNKFIDCEQEIYKNLANIYLDGKKVPYELDSNGRPTDGSKPITQTVESALYRGLSTDNQLAVEKGLLEIIDSDSYLATSDEESEQSKIPTVSLEEIAKHEILP